eukprot:4997241-Pleurochrysis_carterae.AAC.1
MRHTRRAKTTICRRYMPLTAAYHQSPRRALRWPARFYQRQSQRIRAMPAERRRSAQDRRAR